MGSMIWRRLPPVYITLFRNCSIASICWYKIVVSVLHHNDDVERGIFFVSVHVILIWCGQRKCIESVSLLIILIHVEIYTTPSQSQMAHLHRLRQSLPWQIQQVKPLQGWYSF